MNVVVLVICGHMLVPTENISF